MDNPNRMPVSLRRYYPDQVVKGCPFPDSQMIPTPLTRQYYSKSKFLGCQGIFFKIFTTPNNPIFITLK